VLEDKVCNEHVLFYSPEHTRLPTCMYICASMTTLDLPRSRRYDLLTPDTVFKETVLRDCRDKVLARLANEPAWNLATVTYAWLLNQMELEVRAWGPGADHRSITNTDMMATAEAERGLLQRAKDQAMGVKNRNERVWGWINEKDQLICKEYSERDIFAFDIHPHVKFLLFNIRERVFAQTNGSGHTCRAPVHKRCICEVDFAYVLETCDPRFPTPYWPRDGHDIDVKCPYRPPYFTSEEWKPEVHYEQLRAAFKPVDAKKTIKVVRVADMATVYYQFKDDPTLFIQELTKYLHDLVVVTNEVKFT